MKNKIKLIAETAWHHDGNFPFMKKLVSDILNLGRADVLKMHLLLNFDEYANSSYRNYNSGIKKLFPVRQWTDLIGMIQTNKKELMLLLNDKNAIEFGSKFSPEYVEIHSVCLNDIYLLDALRANVNKKTGIVLGIGGSTLYEIEYALERLGHERIIMMFGFQNYPTSYKDVNFRKMQRIMNLFPEFSFGYADHSAWDESDNVLITLMGAALGMDYVEKHVTNVYGEERTDMDSAISISIFNEIADKLILLNICRGDGFIKLNSGEKKYSKFGPMKKAAILKRSVRKGEKLSLDKIKFQRTGEITDLSQLDVINGCGCEILESLPKGSLLYSKHLKRGK